MQPNKHQICGFQSCRASTEAAPAERQLISGRFENHNISLRESLSSFLAFWLSGFPAFWLALGCLREAEANDDLLVEPTMRSRC